MYLYLCIDFNTCGWHDTEVAMRMSYRRHDPTGTVNRNGIAVA